LFHDSLELITERIHQAENSQFLKRMYFNELIYIGDKIFDIKNKELLIYIAWFESSKDIIYSTINIKGDIVKKWILQ